MCIFSVSLSSFPPDFLETYLLFLCVYVPAQACVYRVRVRVRAETHKGLQRHQSPGTGVPMIWSHYLPLTSNLCPLQEQPLSSRAEPPLQPCSWRQGLYTKLPDLARSQLASEHGDSPALLPPPALRPQTHAAPPGLYMAARNPTSGPDVCVARTSSTWPLSQFWYVYFLELKLASVLLTLTMLPSLIVTLLLSVCVGSWAC